MVQTGFPGVEKRRRVPPVEADHLLLAVKLLLLAVTLLEARGGEVKLRGFNGDSGSRRVGSAIRVRLSEALSAHIEVAWYL